MSIEESGSKTIIEKHNEIRKPFLGGYRNRLTDIEYHHASTQTPPPSKSLEELERENIVKAHRETQTAEQQTRSQQCTRDSGTQMPRIGVYYEIPSTSEKILYPKTTYFHSEQLDKLKLEKAIRIQTYIRGWIARKKAKQIRKEIEERQNLIREKEDERTREAEEKRRREIERRRNPKTKEDFDLLYAELEAWVANEKAKIDAKNYTKEERQQALADLLHQHTKLLQTIDRLKITASHNNKKEKIQNQLKEMASSKKLQVGEEAVKIQTPYTTRAKELKKLYQQLALEFPTLDERMEMLEAVKETVQEFDCTLTRDIVELIDREINLLSRNRPEKSLNGMRSRLLNLFLQFIETPEFNPESSKHQTVAVVRSNTQPSKAKHKVTGNMTPSLSKTTSPAPSTTIKA